jgi:16S rRNA C967 or C1407 C5-methylase (RsmB/RsmF family)
LDREEGNVVIEDIPLREQLEQDSSVALFPPLTGWRQKTFAPGIEKCLRILPSATMEGFFVARLRKVASTLPRRV